VNVGTEVSGTIKKIYVDYNSIVKKGEILAKIDDTNYKFAKDQALANVQNAKSAISKLQTQIQIAKDNYQNAKINFQRDISLKKTSNNTLPSQKTYDNDKTIYKTDKLDIQTLKDSLMVAKATLRVSLDSLKSANYHLGKTIIYSPVNGIVLSKNINVGQTVAASFQTPTLFIIAQNLKKMQLQIAVDELDISSIKDNDLVKFTVDAYPNKIFTDKISQIRLEPKNINGVVTYEAIVNIQNNNLLLKPGMSANISIITKTIKNVKIIPRAALLFKPKMKNRVYILKDNKPIPVKVKVLGFNFNKCAVSSKRLKAGEKVIIAQKK
jgi:HlyD family secretion protein